MSVYKVHGGNWGTRDGLPLSPVRCPSCVVIFFFTLSFKLVRQWAKEAVN